MAVSDRFSPQIWGKEPAIAQALSFMVQRGAAGNFLVQNDVIGIFYFLSDSLG